MNSSQGKPVQTEVSSQEVDLFSPKGGEFSAQSLQRARPAAPPNPCGCRGQVSHWAAAATSRLLLTPDLSGSQPAGPSRTSNPLPSSGPGQDPWPNPECFCSVYVLLQYTDRRFPPTPSSNAKIKRSPAEPAVLWLAHGDDKLLSKYRKEIGRKWESFACLD